MFVIEIIYNILSVGKNDLFNRFAHCATKTQTEIDICVVVILISWRGYGTILRNI